MNLVDALFIIMVFCPEALLLISELILQQMKCNNKLVLVEITDLSRLPIILELLGGRKKNRFFEDSEQIQLAGNTLQVWGNLFQDVPYD